MWERYESSGLTGITIKQVMIPRRHFSDKKIVRVLSFGIGSNLQAVSQDLLSLDDPDPVSY